MKALVVAIFALFISVQVAEAATINVFGQSLGINTITGNETAGVTTINGTNVPVIITTLNEGASNILALFNLNATSTGAAINVGGSLWSQPYDGNFSITAGGFNYLSGDFSGVTLGLDGGNTLIFGSAQPPLSLIFTSDVVGMPLSDPTAMALSFTNANGIGIANNSFADFTSNVAGNFSASPIPEPASMVLLGSGLLALVRMRRRK